MIIVKNKMGARFRLLTGVARDHIFKATKAATRKSIQSALDNNGEAVKYLPIVRWYEHAIGYTDRTTVPVSYHRSMLRLGCHSFNRKASATILQWAGVKK